MSNWFSSPLQRNFFIGSMAAWCVLELVNTLVIGRPHLARLRQDRGSYWGLVVTIYLAVLLVFAMRQLRLGLLPTLFQWVGLALLWLGVLVREWAVLSLGRAFTVVVHISPGQSLISSGPYRWIRHPAYTGLILILSGFGLAVGSWLGALLAIVLALVGLSYRVGVEERALLEVFGDEYRNYMRHTGRLFPWVP